MIDLFFVVQDKGKFCDFGELMLSIFLANIIASTSDFYSNRELGKERNLHQRDERRLKGSRGEGDGAVVVF